MKIYRTDGSSEILNEKRLLRVVSKIIAIDEGILKYISEIKDHKGQLSIYLNKGYPEGFNNYVYYTCLKIWETENEEYLKVFTI